MSVFKLQQFSIQQSASAMKVCTDSLTFGAMVPVKVQDNVLDIGAGTGLLSLMAMQLGAASATAVELTPQAAGDARANVSNSPWSQDITVIEQDIIDYAANASKAQLFDLVISNPPFFDNQLKNKDPLRNIARHTDTLAFSQLIRICAQMLKPLGQCYLLIPIDKIEHISQLGIINGLQLEQVTTFITQRGAVPKLAALHLIKTEQPLTVTSIEHCIYQAPQQYSRAAERYLKPFLLRFA